MNLFPEVAAPDMMHWFALQGPSLLRITACVLDGVGPYQYAGKVIMALACSNLMALHCPAASCTDGCNIPALLDSKKKKSCAMHKIVDVCNHQLNRHSGNSVPSASDPVSMHKVTPCLPTCTSTTATTYLPATEFERINHAKNDN